ncbi:MAG: hypothetical protein FJ295_14140 [Planctomycetes bacterium]|nr:hypothetical protein [Planctomycetota bacterium]
MMVTSACHYLLFSEASETRQPLRGGRGSGDSKRGRWRFVLESLQGETVLDVEDEEGADRERLELLAVVRGLEALDEPSRVTLISAGRYIVHGFRHGLPEWRENDWMWERFGEWVPVRNRDLWLRVDRALRFHTVHCRAWHFATPLDNDRRDATAPRGFDTTVAGTAEHFRPRVAVRVAARRVARAARAARTGWASGARNGWAAWLADVRNWLRLPGPFFTPNAFGN